MKDIRLQEAEELEARAKSLRAEVGADKVSEVRNALNEAQSLLANLSNGGIMYSGSYYTYRDNVEDRIDEAVNALEALGIRLL